MRNLIIAVAVIGGLVLAGIGGKYGWDALRHPIADAGIESHMKTGKLEGDARTSFVNSAIQSCEAGFKGNYPKAAVESYCTCIANVSADIITPDELKSLAMTGQVPDSLGKKLDAPVKQCLKDSGLLPAQ